MISFLLQMAARFFGYTDRTTALLCKAAEQGNTAEVERFITLSASKDNGRALQTAAYYGHSQCVQVLIPVSDLNIYGGVALCSAAQNGHLDCVKLLIPVSDLKSKNEALQWAVGHIECVNLLISVCDPNVDHRVALQSAAAQGYIDCVCALLSVSDPKSCNSFALQWASKNGHTDCIDLLFEVSDPDLALAGLRAVFPDEPQNWRYLNEKISSYHQQKILNSEVCAVAGTWLHRRRKI